MTTTVTAKLNVPKGSAYAHLNGQIFEVVEIMSNTFLVLDIYGTKTDFGMKEITDLSRHYTKQNAYAHLAESLLLNEIEFLEYESGRIARGHGELVETALKEAKREDRNRCFSSRKALYKFVYAGLTMTHVSELATHSTEA